MHLIICASNGNIPLFIKACATLWTHGFAHARHLNAMIPTLKDTFTTKLFSRNEKYEWNIPNIH